MSKKQSVESISQSVTTFGNITKKVVETKVNLTEIQKNLTTSEVNNEKYVK